MKHTRSWIFLATLALILVIASVGCADEEWAETEEPWDDEISESVSEGEYGESAREHLEALVDIGPRMAGTGEEQEAATYIRDAFEDMGYAVEMQPFDAESEEDGPITSANVIAVHDGDTEQFIVVGAHYDGVDDGTAADDNASGVAVMLEVAELVAEEATPYTIHFIAFGAEEAGLLGSDAFVSANGTTELENIILMVNLDSLVAGDITYAYSPENSSAARDWVMDYADSAGYDLQTVHNIDLADEEGGGSGDYEAFDLAGIPWLYFEATNWTLGDRDGYTQVDPQYGDDGAIIHTEYDDLEYLDEVFPGRVEEHLNLYVDLLLNLLMHWED